VFNTSGEVIGIAARTIEEGQNLNFAIPIDYAKGMLNSNQAQPLSAFYEPEPQTEGTATEQPTNESVPLPLEPSKNLAAFLTSKLGQWKTPDVLKALGKPIREYTTEGPEAMKKYEYGDSTNLWRGIRLTFEHGTDWLIAVATYPWNMTVAQMKVLFGENFKTYKVEKDGTIMYAYVDRPLLVSANDLGGCRFPHYIHTRHEARGCRGTDHGHAGRRSAHRCDTARRNERRDHRGDFRRERTEEQTRCADLG
jgi:hypothetical protein